MGNGLYVPARRGPTWKENCCGIIGIVCYPCWAPIAVCCDMDPCYCCCWRDKAADALADEAYQKSCEECLRESETRLDPEPLKK